MQYPESLCSFKSTKLAAAMSAALMFFSAAGHAASAILVAVARLTGTAV